MAAAATSNRGDSRPAREATMIRTRRVTRLAVLAAALMLLAGGGYAAWYHFYPGSDRPALVGDDPRIVVQQRPNLAGMDALLEGTLRYDAGTGCLLVETAEGHRSGVAWPRGTRTVVDGDRPGVRVGAFLGRVGGTTMLDGDTVALGGGADARINDQLAGAECVYDSVFRVTGSTDIVNPSR
jgi:hypothetical protein